MYGATYTDQPSNASCSDATERLTVEGHESLSCSPRALPIEAHACGCLKCRRAPRGTCLALRRTAAGQAGVRSGSRPPEIGESAEPSAVRRAPSQHLPLRPVGSPAALHHLRRWGEAQLLWRYICRYAERQDWVETEPGAAWNAAGTDGDAQEASSHHLGASVSVSLTRQGTSVP